MAKIMTAWFLVEGLDTNRSTMEAPPKMIPIELLTDGTFVRETTGALTGAMADGELQRGRSAILTPRGWWQFAEAAAMLQEKARQCWIEIETALPNPTTPPA